ncbi:RNA polymerase sigma factor [Gimesia aquarii]|uniref:RNA polymerase sigma factor YlaC n=1 Tax=Gimesia aquarii TaxID=2527964 RepID=A0A517VWV3_9PLAN|nr:sigma-70 family RNA polymerase sigma factor [Gimesia aquarii]QDT97485.1 RNA polymerase sigma factor YlaC [Gimesia aquarii]
MQRSDSELVEAACAGNIDSFRELYERYYSMTVGIAYSRLSDHHLAEDAAQEAFATACRRLSSLRNAEKFPEWLATICRRTASRLARSLTKGNPIIGEPISPVKVDNIESELVHEALAQLSKTEREVIYLHYFSGLSHEDVARALGISPQAVHGRMQRARRKLAVKIPKSEGKGVINE